MCNLTQSKSAVSFRHIPTVWLIICFTSRLSRRRVGQLALPESGFRRSALAVTRIAVRKRVVQHRAHTAFVIRLWMSEASSANGEPVMMQEETLSMWLGAIFGSLLMWIPSLLGQMAQAIAALFGA